MRKVEVSEVGSFPFAAMQSLCSSGLCLSEHRLSQRRSELPLDQVCGVVNPVTQQALHR